MNFPRIDFSPCCVVVVVVAASIPTHLKFPLPSPLLKISPYSNFTLSNFSSITLKILYGLPVFSCELINLFFIPTPDKFDFQASKTTKTPIVVVPRFNLRRTSTVHTKSSPRAFLVFSTHAAAERINGKSETLHSKRVKLTYVTRR